MSREDRQTRVALKARVKEHMAGNPVFRSEFMELINAEREAHIQDLIMQNNEITRGKIQMLDEILSGLKIGE